MKKIFLMLVALGMFQAAMAQTPEEKAALKAAQKEAKSQMNEGIALRDEINTLYNANQAEAAKGEKAKLELIEQNKVSIKAKGLEAIDVLQKAIASGHVEEKKLFDTYKALDDVSAQVLNPELNLAAKNEPFDTVAFSKSVDAVCQGCYGVLQYGNEKNELQKPTIEADKLKMPKLMVYYAYLTLWYTQSKNIKGAEAAFDKYRSFATDYPLVAEEESVKNPQYPYSQFAFNLYYTAVEMKDVQLAEKYYEQALEYKDESSRNYVAMSRPQLYRDAGDTVKWVAALEDVAKTYSDSEAGENALQNLLSIYSHQGNDVLQAKAKEILEAAPNSKVANYGYGYSLFASEKYEEAKTYFDKALELDGSYTNALYMAGMCEYRQALDNYYKYVDSKKFASQAAMTAAEQKYVVAHFKAAQPYFEKLRELKPEPVDDWASPLQNIYKNIGETAKAAEMGELLK